MEPDQSGSETPHASFGGVAGGDPAEDAPATAIDPAGADAAAAAGDPATTATIEDVSEPVETSAVAATLVPGDAIPASRDAAATRRRGALGYLLAAAAGVAVTIAAFVGSGTVPLGSSPTPSPEPTFAVTAASVGLSTAPVTIEVWADYQCPYCRVFTHGIEPTLLRDYAATGRALVTFRDFAFLGQESVDAAVAARCAGRQGRFWTYHDLLYESQGAENQGAFARPTLDSLATFAALDATAFDACLVDPAVTREVAAETEAGKGFGITSTPTLRITGPGGTKLVKGLTQPNVIAAAIESVAKPAPSGSPAPSGPASPAASGPSQAPGSASPSN